MLAGPASTTQPEGRGRNAFIGLCILGFLSGEGKAQPVPARAGRGWRGVGGPDRCGCTSGSRTKRAADPAGVGCFSAVSLPEPTKERTNEALSFRKNTLLTRSYRRSLGRTEGPALPLLVGPPFLGAAGSCGPPCSLPLSSAWAEVLRRSKGLRRASRLAPFAWPGPHPRGCCFFGVPRAEAQGRPTG